jgi:hypothetical protein
MGQSLYFRGQIFDVIFQRWHYNFFRTSNSPHSVYIKFVAHDLRIPKTPKPWRDFLPRSRYSNFSVSDAQKGKKQGPCAGYQNPIEK